MKILVNKGDFKDLIQREWLISNGIGGFASSTVTGANTRKYHGLLVAALTPPARRYMVLSKVDESLEINGRNYPLYTNICDNYISDGYKKIESFEKKYVPKYVYKIEGITLTKTISMQYGKNTVTVLYTIKNGDNKAKLTLAPIINFRDFHQVNKDSRFDLKEEINNTKVKMIINKESKFPLYMKCSEGNYIQHQDDIFRNMFYLEEEKRGFDPIENHIIPGRYEIELKEKEEKEISFVFSLEENIDEVNAKDVIKEEEKRLKKIVKDTKLVKKGDEDAELLEDFVITADSFLAYRPSFGLHTIIAGYPWFLDWGRDSLIAFEGLLLKTRRFDIAKEVLLTFTKDIKYGLVPNGYSGYDNRPLYNSVDASLLLFEEIKKYINYTQDYKFIKDNFYEWLKKIIESYKNGIDVDNNNIYMERDSLIHSGTPNTQNTWMDVKYGDFAVTPRNGKAVEINSMWYNALKIMEELSAKFETDEVSKSYGNLAEKVKKSFNKKFYNSKKKCLYDVLDDEKVRPNQLFSLSLSYPVLNASGKVAKEMLKTVTDELYTRHGLRTLTKKDKQYVATYEGDSFRRDMSYHQGITWPWLFGIYNNAFKVVIENTKGAKAKKDLQKDYDTFVKNLKATTKTMMYKEGCVQSVSELYDSKPPYLPKGAFSQAWSMAEIFRILIDNKEQEEVNK